MSDASTSCIVEHASAFPFQQTVEQLVQAIEAPEVLASDQSTRRLGAGHLVPLAMPEQAGTARSQQSSIDQTIQEASCDPE